MKNLIAFALYLILGLILLWGCLIAGWAIVIKHQEEK